MQPAPLQLFDPASSTYTYIVWDQATRQALIIDPVDVQLERDLETLRHHALSLRWIVETHTHADHITAASALREHTAAQTATPAGCAVLGSSVQLLHGQVLEIGQRKLVAMHTPGHTAGSMSYLCDQHVFTGDTLLIGGCGRTDFQSGSAADLYRSITGVLFALPDSTIVWPGHDYRGRTSSTIGDEKRSNARLVHEGRLRSQAEFEALMSNLNLEAPKRIHEAVPANLELGRRQDATSDAGILPASDYAGDIPLLLAYRWWTEGQAHLVDIRSEAERAWVGFVPGAPAIEWKRWPGMHINPDFEAQLRATITDDRPVLLLCRSGVRSIAAAKAATKAGFTAYNVLEGFEGDPDDHSHRNRRNGWRLAGLPWRLG
jgi:glyoxylase-like metal-dependent hydrolase (beta-lactamase superfamily II)/rhodanese-related sulfurtransferase